MISSNLVGHIVHAIFSTMAHNMDVLRTHLIIKSLAYIRVRANLCQNPYASMVFHLGKLWKVKH